MGISPLITNSHETRRLGKPVNGTQVRIAHHQLSRHVRLTVNLPKDLVEEMRDAVYWTPNVTLAWLVARAMRTSLAELHSTNRGPFPKRLQPLRAGRPKLTGQSMNLLVQPAIAALASPADHGAASSIRR